MSYQRISEGSPILLRLQAGDGATGVFPLAHVYNSSNTEVAGSPFALVHIGNGLYASAAFTPVTVDHFDASYTVYSDAGHTIVDTVYDYATDSFDVYVLGTGGGGGGSSGCGLTVILASSSLNVILSEGDLITKLEESDLNVALQSDSLTVIFPCNG